MPELNLFKFNVVLGEVIGSLNPKILFCFCFSFGEDDSQTQTCNLPLLLLKNNNHKITQGTGCTLI